MKDSQTTKTTMLQFTVRCGDTDTAKAVEEFIHHAAQKNKNHFEVQMICLGEVCLQGVTFLSDASKAERSFKRTLRLLSEKWKVETNVCGEISMLLRDHFDLPEQKEVKINLAA